MGILFLVFFIGVACGVLLDSHLSKIRYHNNEKLKEQEEEDDKADWWKNGKQCPY